MQKKACGCAEHAKDGGVLPTTGFPRVSGMETSDNLDTVQTRASHTTHAFGPRRSSHHYTFEACVSRRFKNVEGSSHSRVVVEVVVLATVVEVVVHGDGSGSSGTRLGEGLDESEFFGAIGYPFAL